MFDYELCVPSLQSLGKLCFKFFNIYYDRDEFGGCALLDAELLKQAKKMALGCVHSKPLLGVDINLSIRNYTVSKDDAQCLRKQGISHAALQVYSPEGSAGKNTIESIIALRNAGFREINVYHMPLVNRQDWTTKVRQEVQSVFDLFDHHGMDPLQYIHAYWYVFHFYVFIRKGLLLRARSV